MNKILRVTVRVMAILGLLVSLSGCWNNRPVDERDLVFTLGLENGPPKAPLKMIFEFPTPAALLDYAAHKGISAKEHPVSDIIGEGQTLPQCFNQGQGQVSHDLYLGQIQLVEVAQKLNPAIFHETLLELTRVGEMDLTPYIFVSPDPLKEVMQAETNQAQFPTLFYSSLFNCAHCQTINLGVKLWQFGADAATPGIDPHLPYVSLDPNTHTIVTDRVALYRHFQFVTALSPQQTQDFGLLEGLANKVSIFIPQGRISLRSIHGEAHLRTAVVHGKVHATFLVNVTSTLSGTSTITQSPNVNAAIADKVSKVLAQSCLQVIQYTQKEDVDPWGVGRMLNWQHPHTFLKFRHWHQEYPKVAVSVKVNMHVYKLGNIK
ncbi:MAG: hypothetical protein OWR62_07635 [Sulfobacillus thermotolerans]|nr:hypothetical protein [Sulfobacillus thermotolerans]